MHHSNDLVFTGIKMLIFSSFTVAITAHDIWSSYPGIQFRLPCTPRTIFHGCQVVYWDPLDAKQRCPKKIGLGYVKMHGFHGNP